MEGLLNFTNYDFFLWTGTTILGFGPSMTKISCPLHSFACLLVLVCSFARLLVCSFASVCSFARSKRIAWPSSCEQARGWRGKPVCVVCVRCVLCVLCMCFVCFVCFVCCGYNLCCGLVLCVCSKGPVCVYIYIPLVASHCQTPYWGVGRIILSPPLCRSSSLLQRCPTIPGLLNAKQCFKVQLSKLIFYLLLHKINYKLHLQVWRWNGSSLSRV